MIVTVTTFKGGVGKTTTARDVSAALAADGHKVLAVCLDTTNRSLMSFRDNVPGVTFRATTAGRVRRLVESQKKKYDFIVLDCPPALERQAAAALEVADLIIAPVVPEWMAVEQLGKLLAAVESARDPRRRRGGNPELKLQILITMLDTRDPHAAKIDGSIRSKFGRQVFSTTIKREPAFSGAALAAQSVIHYKPRCPGALAYRLLAHDIAAYAALRGGVL